MWKTALHNALGQFLTICIILLQNVALFQNEMIKLLHFGLPIHDALLLHNAAQQRVTPVVVVKVVEV